MAQINNDFLFELYTEEIPASYQRSAIEQLKDVSQSLLLDFLYQYDKCHIYGTSRRLIIYIQGLKKVQKKKIIEQKGPPKHFCFNEDQSPSLQLIKFAEKYKLSLNSRNVIFQTVNNVEYAIAKVVVGEKPITDTIATFLEKLISSIKFPKVMRWEQMNISYPRPIKHYICIHGKKHINLTSHAFFQTFQQSKSICYTNIKTAKSSISLKNVHQYISDLEKIQIIIDPDKRKRYIMQQLNKKAKKINTSFVVHLDEDLLEKVNFLVEHPNIVVGVFSEKFLDLPRRLILSEMQEHQKYFAILDSNDNITNFFLIVANIPFKSKLTTKNISKGNERVLNARLIDATFFFEEDIKIPLIKRVDKLKNINYIKNRGTLFDKKERIKILAKEIILQNPTFSSLNIEEVDLACDLLKTDLTTQLVYEFEYLQGYIGSIYAKREGIPDTITASIEEHYLPISTDQNIVFPKTKIGILLSITDKLDNILIAFSLKKEPKSNQDPLGIRRQCLAIIYTCLEYEINLHFNFIHFSHVFQTSEYISFLKEICSENLQDNTNACLEYLTDIIWNFVSKRMVTVFEKKAYPKKILPAALHTTSTNILDISKKVHFLMKYYHQPEFEIIMSTFIRMNNIVQKSPLKKLQLTEINIDTSIFLDEEIALYHWFKKLQLMTSQHTKNYNNIFKNLIEAKELVTNFFDNIMVNHEDPKIQQNRIHLLNSIILSISPILNLNKLK